ncbi:MAG: lactonase family protein, partial [Planctomycetia bacterium]
MAVSWFAESIFFFAWLFGLQPMGAPTPPPFSVYVSVGGDNRIAVLDLDGASGVLTPRSDLELAGAPGSLGVAPDGRHLYAAVRSTQQIATIARDPKTGALTLVGSAPAVENPVYVVPDATGRFLLTAYYGAAKVAAYKIDENGEVVAGPLKVLDAEKHTHSILHDPSNKFVLAPNCGTSTIMQYKFDEKTGELTPNDPPTAAAPPGSGPRHFRFHPKLPVVYFVNEHASSVTAYKWDAETGTISQMQTTST